MRGASGLVRERVVIQSGSFSFGCSESNEEDSHFVQLFRRVGKRSWM